MTKLTTRQAEALALVATRPMSVDDMNGHTLHSLVRKGLAAYTNTEAAWVNRYEIAITDAGREALGLPAAPAEPVEAAPATGEVPAGKPCRHGAEVRGLEVISLDAMLAQGGGAGIVDAEVPVAMAAAVHARVAVLALADEAAGYRAVHVHTDGCRIPAASSAPSTVAEMFDNPAATTPRPGAGPASAPAPEAVVRLAPVGPRGAATTRAEDRAAELVDALRAAAWDVCVTVDNSDGMHDGERLVAPASRTVCVTARRGEGGQVAEIYAEWSSVTGGARRTTRRGVVEHTPAGGRMRRLRSAAALAAVVAEATATCPPAEDVVSVAMGRCRDCGSADGLTHVEGCRTAAALASTRDRRAAGWVLIDAAGARPVAAVFATKDDGREFLRVGAGATLTGAFHIRRAA